ncbi:MAG: peptidoglycan DD-metalloendopeptidase family protein, partial [bacterium]
MHTQKRIVRILRVCVACAAVFLFLPAQSIFAEDVPVVTNTSDQTNVHAVNANVNTAPATSPQPADVSDLQQQITEKQQKLQDLQRQQQIYQETITQKQQQALSLSNQLSILNDQITSTDLTIQKIELNIDLLTTEIENLASTIEEKNTEIGNQKDRLAELLRVLNRYHAKTTLEITLLNDTFADFFNQLKSLQSVEQQAKDGLDQLSSLKKDLELEKKDQETKRATIQEQRRQLEIEKKDLTGQQNYRQNLLTDTKNSETQYEQLLNKAKQEQLNANSDIQVLEAQIRQRLSGTNELPAGPTEFLWPVASRTITAYFHDPTYPFRKYFEHPAIDIATPQGTIVRATASGFAHTHDGGMGYSYIMLVHGNGLSTVYGHISQIAA